MTAIRWAILVGMTAVLGSGFFTPVQAQKPKEVMWTHAFDLKCRKFGETEFTKNTQKFGVEAFKDTNNSLGVYISQVGSLTAVGTGFAKYNAEVPNYPGPDWVTGLDLPVRKIGEKEFSRETKVHSMEVFRDPATDNWIYITEKGLLSATPAKIAKATGNRMPKWSHAFDLRVRKGGEKDWDKATKYGVEVYADLNTGNLIYICETGSIAVVPGDAVTTAEGKEPEWLHGLDLACRKFNEYSFTKDTRRIGIEVFRDANNDNLIFFTEAGTLAVTPGGKGLKAPTPKVTAPDWKHGLNLKCRKVDQEFADAQKFGVEVFRDQNVGVTLYIAETVSLGAVVKD